MKDLKTIDYKNLTNIKINKNIIDVINKNNQEIEEKTRFFDRSQTQTTLLMSSLPMLNGNSPLRIMRQILAEIEKRKMALAEAQLNYAKKIDKIEKLEKKESLSKLEEAKLNNEYITLNMLETKVNGAFKDIATLIDAYNNIKANHNIDEWTEEQFEEEEKKHHVRRGFELLYRNMIEHGRPKESTIEYLHQFGVNIQLANKEVIGFITVVEDLIDNKGERPTSEITDKFFDDMAEKYAQNATVLTKKLYGIDKTYNTNFLTYQNGE